MLAPVAPETLTVGKTARSASLSGFSGGATYSFTVTPNISGALVDGETSESVSTAIAGTRNTPIPGEQSYSSQNLVFSTTDTSGTWSYAGTAVDDTTVLHRNNCSVSAVISGSLTATSTLTFDWSTYNYYGNGSDTLSVAFIAADGTQTTLWNISNSADASRQSVNISLGSLAGQSGTVKLSYTHSGSYYTSSDAGGRFYAPRITNVLVPSVPAVAWETETLTALGTPEIRSVSSVSEGFYSECGLGTTTFSVTCSESVTSLQALPSHLALVGDNDVTVTPRGNGRFTVSVTPSGVTEDNLRSRMILTLAATDANGTTAYKDLSLRFAPIEAGPSVTVNAASASGAGLTVVIPYAWFVESGLAPSEVSIERAAQFVRFGNAVASLCVRNRGAIPAMPERKDVEEVLAVAADQA